MGAHGFWLRGRFQWPVTPGVAGRNDGAAGDRAEMLGMAMGDRPGAEDHDALFGGSDGAG